MKRFLFISLGIVFCLRIFAQDASFDFRNTKWGMTKSQVEESEDMELYLEIESNLIYKSTIGGKKASIIYSFTNDNELYRGAYCFEEEHTNRNDFINDFEEINKILSNKYGYPISDEKIWLNDLYKNDNKEWGFAVSLGHLRYDTSWENRKTKILHSVNGENYKINHIVLYFNDELNNKKSKEDNLKKQNEF